MRCRLGFDLNADGTCAPQTGLPTGCAQFTPLDPAVTTRACAICSAGQQMNDDKTCVSNSSLSTTCPCAAYWSSSTCTYP